MKKRPPKPRLPGRAKSAVKVVDGDAGGRRRRVTTVQLADRLDEVAQGVERIEQAIAPKDRSSEVSADEHALLNLVDAIVDRRTEGVLLPLAHLATILDRLVDCPDPADQPDLLAESRVQLDVVLESLGLERIAPQRGDESDPWLHEEVDVVERSDLEEGLILRLVRPGIRISGGKTLVPALVAVSGGSD